MSPEKLSLKIEATLEPCATSLLVPRHLGNAFGRPMPGLGTSEWNIFATGLLACNRPVRKVIGCAKIMGKIPPLAHGFQDFTLSLFSLLSIMETLPFSTQKSNTFLRMNPRIALLVNMYTNSV